jgi:hypothetical protein
MTKCHHWTDDYIPFSVADSMGGTAANIAGKTTEQIEEIRDWCEWILAKRKEGSLEWPRAANVQEQH